jgi:hypothetical protein
MDEPHLKSFTLIESLQQMPAKDAAHMGIDPS